MGRLIYSVIGSLDGYINDASGSYDWAEPDEELIAFLNDEISTVTTNIYGRRMYEELTVWETDTELAADSPATASFAELWKAADKVVFSTTLTSVSTKRTRLEPRFDVAIIEKLKAESRGDLTIEGPTLAAHALRAGLVDEIQRYVAPVIVGGGVPLYPSDVRLDLELVEERRFPRGIAFLRYRVR